jgi:hypothetical protein
MEHGSAVAIDFTSITYTLIDFGCYIKLPIVRFLQNTKLMNRLISMLSIFSGADVYNADAYQFTKYNSIQSQRKAEKK